MMNLRAFFKQMKVTEYRTSSLYGVLIVLTILFVFIVMLVQFDPMNLPYKTELRSPTGTLEVHSR